MAGAPLLSVKCRARAGTFELDIDFSVSSHFTALFGPSGCGKSSTLRVIAGLLTPYKGTIKIGDTTVFDGSRRLNVKPEKRRIGLIFQDSRLFPHLSVHKNLQFALSFVPAKARQIEFADAVDVLGIADLLDRWPGTLSGGESQRVAIARALLASPQLLLMDEPLAAVDEPAKLSILAKLRKIQTEFNLPVLYVSHDLGTVLNLARHVIRMAPGKVLKQGPPFTVLEDYVSTRLAGGEEIGNLIEGEIRNHDEVNGTTEIHAGRARFLVHRLPDPVGSTLILDIPASEILIAAEKPRALSARNVLEGTISEITHIGSRIIVKVEVGVPLLVEIVPGALQGLALAQGREVYLIIKATAFRRVQ